VCDNTVDEEEERKSLKLKSNSRPIEMEDEIVLIEQK
jgi:hypothetical protein